MAPQKNQYFGSKGPENDPSNRDLPDRDLPSDGHPMDGDSPLSSSFPSSYKSFKLSAGTSLFPPKSKQPGDGLVDMPRTDDDDDAEMSDDVPQDTHVDTLDTPTSTHNNPTPFVAPTCSKVAEKTQQLLPTLSPALGPTSTPSTHLPSCNPNPNPLL